VRAPDPTAAPAIRPNYLADETDRRTLVAGLKIARRIVSNPALERYRAYEMNPGDQCQSDDDFLDYARRSGQTAFHVIGPCKMGNDPMAIVDDELRVRGLEGLRVVDASIMPTMVSGNTNATVIMIAEKGADMIKPRLPSGRELHSPKGVIIYFSGGSSTGCWKPRSSSGSSSSRTRHGSAAGGCRNEAMQLARSTTCWIRWAIAGERCGLPR
jgi:GMC oxidoreductase